MQVQDEKKRQKILESASKLFARRPYHRVCLDEVAADAGVGKGTLYTYFTGKDDLYVSLFEHAMGQLVDRLERRLIAEPSAAGERLPILVGEIVDYAGQHPYLFELARSGLVPMKGPGWEAKRKALMSLIERVIREGIEEGELSDPNPQITAMFIPGLVRSVMLHRSRGRSARERQQLKDHILRFVSCGIARKEAP